MNRDNLLVVNGKVYSATKLALRVSISSAMSFMAKRSSFGISAIQKGNRYILMNQTFDKDEDLTKQVDEYRKAGFVVHYFRVKKDEDDECRVCVQEVSTDVTNQG